MRHLIATILIGSLLWAPSCPAQVFYPGQFSIDGIPVVCGPTSTIVTSQINDGAMFNGQSILLNPMVLGRLPTVIKLWAYAHECGHYFQGMSETGADCWAISVGRDQGWFTPNDFAYLIQFFRNNPGDLRHPPGESRVRLMIQCYQSG